MIFQIKMRNKVNKHKRKAKKGKTKVKKAKKCKNRWI